MCAALGEIKADGPKLLKSEFDPNPNQEWVKLPVGGMYFPELTVRWICANYFYIEQLFSNFFSNLCSALSKFYSVSAKPNYWGHSPLYTQIPGPGLGGYRSLCWYSWRNCCSPWTFDQLVLTLRWKMQPATYFLFMWLLLTFCSASVYLLIFKHPYFYTMAVKRGIKLNGDLFAETLQRSRHLTPAWESKVFSFFVVPHHASDNGILLVPPQDY